MDRKGTILLASAALLLSGGLRAFAQQPAGPQTSAPPPVRLAPRPPDAPQIYSGERITIPAGTRFSVVLENGISTRSAKPGDSLYFRTSFPVTEGNRIIVPHQRQRRIPHEAELSDFSKRLHRGLKRCAAQC